jgi:hypothetical protein
MKSISKLKKELDKWFSLYIRLRYATDEGMAQCYTCGKVDHYKKLQCGHFMSRRFYTDQIGYYKSLVENLKKEKLIE